MREDLKLQVQNLKKENIINAAEIVFSELCVEHATMDDIAEKIGMSKRTVYTYFSSKVDLFNAIFFRASKKLYEFLEKRFYDESFTSKSIEEKYKIFWNDIKCFKKENSLYFKIITMYENQPSDFSTKDENLKQAYEWLQKAHELVKKLIVETDTAFVKDKNKDELAIILWMSAMTALNFIEKKELYLKQEFNIEKDNFTDSVFEYITTPLLK